MGKYMCQEKGKSSGDKSAEGVKTRAKTRSGLSYLQLRSRRLEKPPIVHKKRAKRVANNVNQSVKKDAEKVAENEGSFGQNFDVEGKERSTRESTPCSLIRDPEVIRTPGSSTRPTCSAQTQRRANSPMLTHIPTAHDMDEFFTGAEVQQQQQFIEKYNFDPVKEEPLPGRYEWLNLKPKS